MDAALLSQPASLLVVGAGIADSSWLERKLSREVNEHVDSDVPVMEIAEVVE